MRGKVLFNDWQGKHHCAVDAGGGASFQAPFLEYSAPDLMLRAETYLAASFGEQKEKKTKTNQTKENKK